MVHSVMDKKKRIFCVVGTRPEVIKMAPVVLSLRRSDWADVKILATAQHRELLDQMLEVFGLRTDMDLNVMQKKQELPELTAKLIMSLDNVLSTESPDIVLAQGDTTTVMTAALAAFYRRIPFGHVEAGLRTGDMMYPYPEEMNRVLAGHLATIHFAPTEGARRNLVREGIPETRIHVTGNTVIDSLLMICSREGECEVNLEPRRRLILVTAHRRENFGAPLLEMCRALKRVVERNPDVQVLYPVHPNPNVREPVYRELGDHPRIGLCAPIDYASFALAMKRAYLILTDSGGVQEEAPALGKPVLVLREETERPEAVEEGVVKLVGTNCERIVGETQELLDNPAAYRQMAKGTSPYGDGKAADRIVCILKGFLS
jgi:UDP-N-acetylglucosamine 2-epimerase (non-hydrolysing)